jgi:hypothetical protein
MTAEDVGTWLLNALAWLRTPKGKLAISLAGILAIAGLVLALWPRPKPPAPIVPPEVIRDVREASEHEGRAEAYEEQADGIGERADAIEQEIQHPKPKPQPKPLEDESDEAVSRDMSDLLGRLHR